MDQFPTLADAIDRSSVQEAYIDLANSKGVDREALDAAYEARLAQIEASPIEARLKKGLIRSLDILEKALERNDGQLPVSTAMRYIEVATRALGYGKSDPAPVQVNMNVHLEKQRERLLMVLGGARKQIEVQP